MTFLVLTTIITILFLIITFSLLFKIHLLYKKLKYVDEAKMWHKLAITDDLTGIYNRNAYNNKIIKMKENITKKLYGIILFDVDDFKVFNDTEGHLVGDRVLKEVAKILLEIFPEPKYRVFRIGGDEFAVISENVSENEIIKRLLVLKEHLESSDNIRLSKGYSIVDGNIDQAFKYADEMLYADKQSKKSSHML
ncbi:MAG: GGDEF domain-containing protein [Clostridia bacterium]|nr:GGDEF domain-containing protein [Clostridia bacterium]